MLNLYQSNDMHVLVEAFCRRMPERSGDPFQPSIVLTQSHGTGQWLKLEVAKRTGISANIQTSLPAHFIFDLYQKELDISENTQLSIEVLTFRMFGLLQQLDSEAALPSLLAEYLGGQGDADLRRFQLAGELANLFDQYLVYRPDWLNAWQAGQSPFPAGDQAWQAQLWRTLLQRWPIMANHHRAALHARLQKQLKRNLKSLHDGISVFGLSTIAPMHMETLQALSAHVDVDIYFLNPCEHYWGDIAAERDLFKKSVRELIGKKEPLEDDDYQTVGHPLLASFGKQGREYFEMLFGEDHLQVVDLFRPTKGNSTLAHLQRDILSLSDTPEAKNDHSVTIHVCHSKTRELEVLLDQLLWLFDHTDISAHEVIVMSPAIADYAPFINAVFRGRIQYGIADQSPLQQSSLVTSFISLVSLPNLRMTSIEVMDILQVPAIQKKFELTDEALNQLAHWIADTGIRWEFDGEAKQIRWQLPAVNQNTWQFGLDRLLMGVMVDEASGLYDNVLPRNVNSQDLPLLAKLIDFIEELVQLRTEVSAAHTASEWQGILGKLLNDFFSPTGSEVVDADAIQKLLARFPEWAEAGGVDTPLSAELVRHWLTGELAVPQSSLSFVSAGVTFATLVPMRSVPFRAVYLIGMNDGAFPRQQQKRSFDLIPKYPRKGDRSRRLDDRYLFLEAIISAREFLFISYEGRALKDNAIRPPSVLVGELTDYLRATFGHVTVVEHPLQPFSYDYFLSGNALSGNAITTYQHDWFRALTAPISIAPYSQAELKQIEVPDAINLDELSAFLRNAAAHFLANSLGVYFRDNEVELLDAESFQTDALDDYQLAEAALGYLMAGGELVTWANHQIAGGVVMDNDIGRGQLAHAAQRAQNLHAELVPALKGTKPARRTITVNNLLVSGLVPNWAHGRQVYYRVGSISEKHQLTLWGAHLFANVAWGASETIVVARKKGTETETYRFAPLEPADASNRLSHLVALYLHNLSSPVCLPPKTSRKVADLHRSGEPYEEQVRSAMSIWDGERFPENEDRSWARVFTLPDDLSVANLELMHAVWNPLLDHWQVEK